MSVLTFVPLVDNVLIALEPEPEQSSIIKVQRSIEGLTRFGEVLAVGPECRVVKVGQRVLASVTAGSELPHGMLISERAILALEHQ